MNAIMGQTRPGDMGFDVVHLNLHKTFSTPHGGGGPGSGPVLVAERLVTFLPRPLIKKEGERYAFDCGISHSIGKVAAFWGNFLVLVRAYAYIISCGAQGLSEASRHAVLNANYLMSRLSGTYEVAYGGYLQRLAGPGLPSSDGVLSFDRP